MIKKILFSCIALYSFANLAEEDTIIIEDEIFIEDSKEDSKEDLKEDSKEDLKEDSIEDSIEKKESNSFLFSFGIDAPQKKKRIKVKKKKKEGIQYKTFSPIYKNKEVDKNKLITFPPFYSEEYNDKQLEREVMWPLYSSHTSDAGAYWRFINYYSFYKDDGRFRSGGIFPLLYWGHDNRNYDDTYFGFFPFYGKVKDIIGYDEVDFTLFPLYLRLKQERNEEINYIWPFISTTKGEKTDKFRVFPFYSRHTRFNEYEIKSIMWPFYISHKSLKEGSTDYSWMAWPFMGVNQWDDVKETTYLWPFFRTIDRGDKGDGFDCPWPFISYKKNIGETKEKLMFWPFYGYSENQEGDYNSFFLWPLGGYSNEDSKGWRIERFYFLPYYTKKLWDKKEVLREDFKKFWPLFTSCEKDGLYEFRTLDLWPARSVPIVERNLQPLWSLFEYATYKENYRYSFLWNAFVNSVNKENDTFFFRTFPFYSSKKYLKQLPKSQKKVIEKNYLLGLISTTEYEDKTDWTLLWFIDL